MSNITELILVWILVLTFSYFRPKFFSFLLLFFFFFFRVFEVKFKGGEEKAYIYIYLKKYAMDRYVYHDIFKEICIYLYMTSCGGIGARNERIAENSI